MYLLHPLTWINRRVERDSGISILYVCQISSGLFGRYSFKMGEKLPAVSSNEQILRCKTILLLNYAEHATN